MNGITHKIGGACTGIIVATCLPNMDIKSTAIIVGASVIGSLIPDIDEPNSIVGKKVHLLSKGIKKILGHRGIIHTPLWLALNVCLLYWLHLKFAPNWIANFDYNSFPWMYYVCLGFGVGYASHLFLDFITPQGIMLFYPLSDWRFHIGDFKGKHRDLWCSIILILTTIAYLGIKYNYILINTDKLGI